VSSSGGDTQGGSTLTMQYVKQVRYYQAGHGRAASVGDHPDAQPQDGGRTVPLDIEKEGHQDEILLKYLNIAFFGENSYGIGTAARTSWQGRQGSHAAAGGPARRVVKAPSEFDPFVPANHNAAIDRAQSGDPEPRRRPRHQPGRGRQYKAGSALPRDHHAGKQ